MAFYPLGFEVFEDGIFYVFINIIFLPPNGLSKTISPSSSLFAAISSSLLAPSNYCISSISSCSSSSAASVIMVYRLPFMYFFYAGGGFSSFSSSKAKFMAMFRRFLGAGGGGLGRKSKVGSSSSFIKRSSEVAKFPERTYLLSCASSSSTS